MIVNEYEEGKFCEEAYEEVFNVNREEGQNPIIGQ